MVKKTVFILCIMLVLSSAVLSQNKFKKNSFLAPEPGLFGGELFTGYYQQVYSVLVKKLKTATTFQMVVIPSFQSEWMVGAYELDKHYYLFSSVSKTHIWGYQMLSMMRTGEVKIIYSKDENTSLEKVQENEINTLEKSLPKTIDEIDTDFISVEIPEDFYKTLIGTWAKVLSKTNYDSKNFGLDGVRYHFQVSDPWMGHMSGNVWSPDSTTVSSKFVDLGSLIKEYVKNKENKSVKEKIEKLCSFLSNCEAEDTVIAAPSNNNIYIAAVIALVLINFLLIYIAFIRNWKRLAN